MLKRAALFSTLLLLSSTSAFADPSVNKNASNEMSLQIDGTEWATLDNAGTVSATAFVGDGSGLTGVTATSAIDDLTDAMTNAASFTIILGHEGGSITSGINNIVLGHTALDSATTSDDSVAIGYGSLTRLETGSANTAVGYNAMALGNVDDAASSAFGVFSLMNGGSNSTAFGHSALFAGSTASSAFGFEALNAATGTLNTAIGYQAGDNITTGARNIMLGASVDASSATGDDQLNIGDTIYGDLSTDQIAIGLTSPNAELDVSGTVSATAFVGDGSGLTGVTATVGIDDLTDGIHDTDDYGSLFLGNGSGANDDGTNNLNVAIGVNTLTLNTSGQNNVAVGYTALDTNTTGVGNTGVGSSALTNSTGSENTGLGAFALYQATSGERQVAVGWAALGRTTTGGYNTALGNRALRQNVTGSRNVAVGTDAGLGISVSSDINDNVFVGYQSGLDVLTGADNNTFIGYQAGDDVTTGADNVLIGSGVDTVGGITASNELNIGNTIYGDLANDMVSIGITVPTEELEVSGTVSATAFVGDGSGLTGVAAGSAGSDGELQYNNGGTTAGANNVFWDDVNERLGLGDATPSYTLDVSGTARVIRDDSNLALTVETNAVGSDPTMIIANTNGGGNAASLGFNVTGAQEFKIEAWDSGVSMYTPGADLLKIFTNNSTNEGIQIDSSNQIGMGGITTPNSALDVSGTVSATAFVGDGSGLTGVTATVGIHNLTDGQHDPDDYSSLYLGNAAGASDDGSDNRNLGIGRNALTANTVGIYNVAMGGSALASNTTEDDNVAIGYAAMTASTGANDNVSIGSFSMADNITGDSNAAVGYYAMNESTGSGNVAMGLNALRYATGNFNTALGGAAGTGSSGLSGASNNTFVGFHAGQDVRTAGIENTFVGSNAGSIVTDGFNNTFIGEEAGDIVTTGDRNIMLGTNTNPTSGGVNDELNIGDTLYGDLANDYIGIGIPTTSLNVALDVSGSIEYTGSITDVSDKRLKQDIEALPSGQLDNILKVKSVSFAMKDNPSVKELGVIAQELEGIYPTLVKTANDEMGTKSVNYIGLIAPLIQAVQEQQTQIEELKAEIKTLKSE